LPVEEADRTRRDLWPRMATAVFVLLALSAAILEFIPEHYYAIAPGSASPVAPMINVKGYPPVHGQGKLYMVDVTVAPVNHLLEELYWKTQPNVELDPAQAVVGNLSNQQYLRVNDQLMSNSIQTAEVVALEIARGYKVHYKTAGPEVIYTLPGSPGDKVFQAGDIITEVAGLRARTAEHATSLIRKHRPGSVIPITILRRGHVKHVSVRSKSQVVGTGKHRHRIPLIGIEVQNQVALPVKMRVSPGNVGGPSAGLMFTLGLIERLERRDIAKGCKVVGTGEIEWDGSVTAIGGARQKVVAAADQGAKYFFVPDVPENVNPARAAHAHITIVPVKTARQALNFLNRMKPCR
jgi:PDZ domain-containing protein